MRSDDGMIRICEPEIGEEEKKYVLEALDEGEISGHGRHVKLFEERFAKFIGSKHAILVPNGTIALHLALVALGIGKGDAVILPSQTISVCAFSVTQLGATLVVVDAAPDTWCMNVEQVDSVLYDICSHKIDTVHSNKCVIMPVHIFAGIPCDMKSICEIVNKHESRGLSIRVVEDTCEAFGSEYCFPGKNGNVVRRLGSIGDMGCFSLFANKTIACFPKGTRVVVPGDKHPQHPVVTKPIEDISVGDIVLSYNNFTGAKEWDEVAECFNREEEQFVRVELSNGNVLDTTIEHPVFVHHKGWIKASELGIGDRVIQYQYPQLHRRLYARWRDGKSLAEIHGGEDNAMDVISARRAGLTSDGRRRMGLGTKRFWEGRNYEDVFGVEKASKRRESMSISRMGVTFDARYGVDKAREIKNKMSEASKRNWKTSEYRDKVVTKVKEIQKTPEYIAAYVKGIGLKQTCEEASFMEFLDTVSPSEFLYNGDYRCGVSIDGRIPDYVNVNKKKIVELFGCFHHNCPLCYPSVGIDEETELKRRYREFGWDSIVVWQHELSNVEVLEKKVCNFVYNPDSTLEEVTKILFYTEKKRVYNLRTAKNNNFFAYGILVHNCGEGGVITTSDDALNERLRYFRNCAYGPNPETRFWAADQGFNYRASNMVGAIGLGQLDKLQRLLDKRVYLYNFYRDNLDESFAFQKIPRDCIPVPWMTAVLVSKDHNNKSQRGKFMDYMKKKNIETRPTFPPLGQHPYLKEHYTCIKRESVSQDIWENGVILPSGGKHLTDDVMKYICDKANEFVVKG